MDPPTSLCPGYRQVDAFGPDEEYEEEEEVFYVTLDLGDVEPTLVPSSTSYRLIGLDTSTPYIQLQGTILKGRHDQLLGTEMIFTDDKESHDWTNRSVIHIGNTEQRIAFQEVTLIPKPKPPVSQYSSSSNPLSMAMDIGEGPSNAQPSSNTDAMPATNPFEPPQPTHEQRTIQIDRMTGKCGPPPRAPRTRKSASGSTSTNTTARSKSARKKGKGKAKEADFAEDNDNQDGDGEEGEVTAPERMSTRSRSARTKTKGKGKEKEASQDCEDMDMDGFQDDEDDDMYMDE